MAAGWCNEVTKVLLTVWGNKIYRINLMALCGTKLFTRKFQLFSKNAAMNFNFLGSSAGQK